MTNRIGVTFAEEDLVSMKLRYTDYTYLIRIDCHELNICYSTNEQIKGNKTGAVFGVSGL